MLIGADGIHSKVREALYPNEGPARWNGAMLWRGAIDWPVFLTGRSMIVAGGMAAKLVLYPIAAGRREGHAADQLGGGGARSADGSIPPDKEDWSRPGRFEDLMPHVRTVQHSLRQCPGPDRGDARSSGNIRCAIATRCRAGRTAA